MSESNYSVFNALVDIVASPGKALDEVKNHTAWLWWPLVITIVLATGVFAFYFHWVDFDWLVDETIRAMPAEQQAQAADRVRQFMNPTTSTMTTTLAIVVVTFLIYTIQSAYLHLANKLTAGADIGFGQWFSFSSWTAFPNVFGSLAMIVVIVTAANNQVAQTDLTPLSMNALFIHAQPGDAWFRWGSSLSLLNIWMLVLMSIGYARWTGSSMLKSTITAVLPWGLIFGLWAAFI